MDSDHHPVTVWIKERIIGERRRDKEKNSRRWKGMWTEEGRREFRRMLEKDSKREKGVEEEWIKVRNRIGRTREGGREERKSKGRG